VSQPDYIDPVHYVEPIRKKGRRRPRSPLQKFAQRITRRINWRIALAALLSLIVIAVVAGLALTTDAQNRVYNAATSLSRVLTTITERSRTELTLVDFERLQASVDDLRDNLAAARQQTFFLPPLAALNAELAATLQAADIAEQTALAASDMLRGLQPTLFFLLSGGEADSVVMQLSSGERIIELLQIGRAQFVSAGEHLAAARERTNQLQSTRISAGSLLNLENLKRYQDQLLVINTLVASAPDLLNTALGLNGERSYLILSQNSDELRPSGGYISTFGWMTVRNGRITDYAYSPTTATSPNPPPQSLQSPFPVPEWWIEYRQPIYAAWDGSWHADFPSTASMAKWYYDSGSNPHAPVDGVIGIDLVGFEIIMGALGEARVPGYATVVTAENLRQVVYDIREQGDLEHKRFVAALYKQIFGDWQGLNHDREKSAALLNATLKALQEKHLMFYFADEALNEAVRALGWSGAQTPSADHDYLMVADANLGNKSNHSITRQITYDVDIQTDGTLAVRAAIAYDYPAYMAEQDPAVDPRYHGPLDYNNLMQVFVPLGSTLTSSEAPGTQAVQSETHTLFISQVKVSYGSGERLAFSYTTPALIEPLGAYQRYRLLLQKQPGMVGEMVQVQISLPPGATVINTTPEAAASYNLDRPILEFRADLTTDQWIEVIYRGGG
jgi:hypothetical protein